MSRQVIFIQGAGQGAYDEDEKLVDSLRDALGSGYNVLYPAMPNEDEAEYAEWRVHIEEELANMQDPVILVGHSIGGAVLIKCMSEITTKKKIAGIFLLATPFWGSKGWLYEGYEKLALAKDFATKLPKVPVFLYHCRDDEIAPFAHLALYAKELPEATVRELDQGGHRLNNDLTRVATDIKNL